uniref:SRCR domain-containing protein n=1 Tax=Sphenodon punctatus TaxID=8508 RepID=A0A8D0HQ72_SPHPU
MRAQHSAFSPLILVGMWVIACCGGDSQSCAGWKARLNGAGSQCSGQLEVCCGGDCRRVCSRDWSLQNAEMVFKQLNCGSPFGVLLKRYLKEPVRVPGQETMTYRWKCQENETAQQNCSWVSSNCTDLLDVVCIEPTKSSTAPPKTPPPTSPIPTGPPRLRLAQGNDKCSGTVELYIGGYLGSVCMEDQDSKLKHLAVASQICHKVGCGDAFDIKNTKEQSLPILWKMVPCTKMDLSLECFNRTRTCQFPSFVKCMRKDITGVGPGTIMSILLGLVLLGVLLVICGPPTYKKIVKKYTKKRQHQWIGPTALNQNVSFHRNSTVTPRPRLEGQGAQGEENDYAQAPKKNSYLSAYPALEGTIRSSNPPDNSSDSDYDLHSAQRLSTPF